jgi:hypothetical protein
MMDWERALVVIGPVISTRPRRNGGIPCSAAAVRPDATDPDRASVAAITFRFQVGGELAVA